MTKEPHKPKPINLDELIAKHLPEGITYAEYRDASKDPQHPLHDPDNPRHEAYVQAEETMKKSAQTTSEAITKMMSSEWLGTEHKRIMDEAQKLVKLPVESLDDLFKPQTLQVDTSFLAQDHMADFGYGDTLMGRIEKAQEATVAARLEREKRDAQRHEELRDILLTLSTNAVDQRDEIAKMREGQEMGEKWQKTATKWGLAIGALTLVATLASIGVTVFLAVWFN